MAAPLVLASTLAPGLDAALAGERPGPPNHCAAMYGPGFAPLAGSPNCVKIDGRVRVEAGVGSGGVAPWRVAPEAGAASRAASPGGFVGAPAPRGPSHVHVPRKF
jgi:hypothetical protein